MNQFTLRFLGQFQISIDANPILDFHSDKARALLAYLALEPKEHTRVELAALLWPEIGDQYARTNLRNTLHRLRQTLDAAAPGAADHLLSVTRQTVQFKPDSAAVDVLRFQVVWRGLPAGDALAVDQLEEAAGLYQGELLFGFGVADAPPFEEWLLLRRELLQQQALLLLHRLTTAHETAGAYDRAYAASNRLLTLDPYREESYRQLMRLLARMGQPDQALYTLEQLRRLLRTEMGVDPAPETVALAQQIAAGAYDPMTGSQARPEQSRTDDKLSAAPRVILSPPHPVTLPLPPPTTTALDLREVPEPGPFFGRVQERRQIVKWLLDDQCKVAAILGIGGMGKTTLAAQCIREIAMGESSKQFDTVYWRSLLNAPPLTELLPPLLQLLSSQQLTAAPASVDEQLRLLLSYLRTQRVLLVLDNLESILDASHAGVYRAGYEPYGQLIQQVATLEHQSHLLLTSRERPRGYARLERDGYPVQSLQLAGLDTDAGRQLLLRRGVDGDGAEAAMLIARYSGNPLALKLVADTVDELFGGDIAEFLKDESLVFDDIRTILDQQFARLTKLEQEVLLWLMIEREPVSTGNLRRNFLHLPPQRMLIEALRSLQRRSLVEHQGADFALQNVVSEYLSDYLVTAACAELENNVFQLLHHLALLKATAKEYVRQSQERLLLAPITAYLVNRFGGNGVADRLQSALIYLQEQRPRSASYAGGNLVNLLRRHTVDLTGFDFSHLTLRQVYLQGATLVNTNFGNVEFVDAVFTDSFGLMNWIALSPDNQRMAVGFESGEIALWQLPDAQPEGVLTGHERRVRWITFSPDNQRLVSASIDQTVRIWDVATGHCLMTLRGHQKGLHSAVFSPDGRYIASSGLDHVICLWSATTGKLLTTFYGHSDWVNALAFHPAGHLLASASHDNTVRLWDLQAIDQPSQPQPDPLYGILTGHYRATTVAFNPDGALLASGGADATVRLWEVASLRAVQTLRGHTNWVRHVAFTPDGSRLASSGVDQRICLWALPSGTIIDTLQGHKESVLSFAFTSDGQMLVSVGFESIRLWDLSNPLQGQTIRTLRGSMNRVMCVAFAPNGTLLASGTAHGTVNLWPVADEREATFAPRPLTGHTDFVNDLVFSPDGATLVSAGRDGSIRLWDVDSAACLDVLVQTDNQRVECVAFTATGSLLASAGAEGIIHLWRRHGAGRWQLDDLLRVDTREISRLVFSADGRRLVYSTAERSVHVWDLASQQSIYRFEGYEQDFWSLIFLPQTAMADPACANAEFLLGGNRSGVIYLWDLAAENPEEPVRTVHAHSGVLRSLAFNSITGYLATGSEDHTVKVWDMKNSEALYTLTGHQQSVTSVDFRRDGRILASGSTDGDIKLWDVQEGTCINTLRIPGPYAGMKITGVTGISEAQRASLRALGAVER